jgi:hypothetical protein
VDSLREEEDHVSDEESGGGYGGSGRNWVKYLVIYLVVAAVAYGVIYLAFIRDGSGGGGY